jgi:hypothetical protein
MARRGVLPLRAGTVVQDIANAMDTGGLLSGRTTGHDAITKLTLAELAERCASPDRRRQPTQHGSMPLPTNLDPTQPLSESRWKLRIDESLDTDPALVLANALGLLVTLWSRWRETDDPLSQTFFSMGGRTRLALRSMFTEFDRRATTTILEVLTWLLDEYTIGQHMRVATNKLRTEGLDTFWFHAQETGYELHPDREVRRARPGYNAPKLWAATSSLLDLGLLRRTQTNIYRKARRASTSRFDR